MKNHAVVIVFAQQWSFMEQINKLNQALDTHFLVGCIGFGLFTELDKKAITSLIPVCLFNVCK